MSGGTEIEREIRYKNAKIEVKVTDRFGNVYTEAVENK